MEQPLPMLTTPAGHPTHLTTPKQPQAGGMASAPANAAAAPWPVGQEVPIALPDDEEEGAGACVRSFAHAVGVDG